MPDSSIDFDGDGVVDSNKLILLRQNQGRTIADTSLALASGAGPNLDVLPNLDFQIGNSEIDGVLTGVIAGPGTEFEVEVFVIDVQSELSGVVLRFGLDLN